MNYSSEFKKQFIWFIGSSILSILIAFSHYFYDETPKEIFRIWIPLIVFSLYITLHEIYKMALLKRNMNLFKKSLGLISSLMFIILFSLMAVLYETNMTFSIM